MNIRPRYIIIGFTAVVAIIIGIFIYTALNPSGSLTVALAPEEGTLTIDGKARSVRNSDSIGLPVGEHTVSFSRDEFKASAAKKITIEKGKTARLVFVLEPLTDAARALLQTAGAQKVREENGGQEIVTQSAETVKKNPILGILPITARLYTINACPSQKYPDDPDKIALCVNSSDGASLDPYIKKDIQSHGYNPDEFEIIYINEFDEAETPSEGE